MVQPVTQEHRPATEVQANAAAAMSEQEIERMTARKYQQLN